MWLHSSVGRASHRYHEGHGFESRWSPDFFRLLLSNCLNWTIYCDDHSALWSTTAVQLYELFSYILHIRIDLIISHCSGNEPALVDWTRETSRNPAEKRKLERFYYHFFVSPLKILWQLRMMAFRNEHPEWDQNPWFILLTDSNETKSILDFSICLSFSPPGKTVCYRKRRIHDERASQFFSALHSIFLLLKPQIVDVCKSI